MSLTGREDMQDGDADAVVAVGFFKKRALLGKADEVERLHKGGGRSNQ